MVLHAIRIFFLLVVLAITVSFAWVKEIQSTGQGFVTWYILTPIMVAFLLVLVDTFWHQKRLQMLSGLFFGVLAGLAIAYMLSLIVELIAGLLLPTPVSPPGTEPRLAHESLATRSSSAPALTSAEEADLRKKVHDYDATHRNWLEEKKQYDDYIAKIKTVQMVKLLLGTAVVFMCVTFVVQTKDDFRFVIPYVEFSKQTKGARPLLLDTSVIIDGRIADIADTRILESEVIVPRFVLAELQAIADSDDKLKRNRGRRGLDVLNKLQGSSKIDIRILDARVPAVDELGDVDTKLVALAQHMDGRIVTNDYNLNKISQLRGVDVININDLANALKPIVLPGETMHVKVLKPGEEMGQGVGYLEDGTMVVAEQARDFIGKEVVIVVTSVLQTSAGRMIFGRMDPEKSFSRRHATPGPAIGHAPPGGTHTNSAGGQASAPPPGPGPTKA